MIYLEEIAVLTRKPPHFEPPFIKSLHFFQLPCLLRPPSVYLALETKKLNIYKSRDIKMLKL